MPFTQDDNLGLFYGWDFGETPWNEEIDKNMVILGGVACLSVISATTTVPPAPSDGDVYFVPSGATGVWSGKDNNIAIYESERYNQWIFRPVKQGWLFTVKDSATPNKPVTFDGSSIVDAVDLTGYLRSDSSYTATGQVDFTNTTRFTGTHGSDPLELANIQDIEDRISAQDFSDFVDRSTDQTVSGIKTFLSSPKIPDATSQDEPASLAQVSSAVANITGQSLGSGQSVYSGKVSDVLQFYSLKSSDSSVSIGLDGNEIDISVAIPAVKDNFSELDDTPLNYSGSAGKFVKVKQSEDGLEYVEGFDDRFSSLIDVDGDYSGQSGKLVAVKAAEDGLEFIDPNAPTIETFLGLSDTPSAYSGAGWIIRINSSQSGLEAVNPSQILSTSFTSLSDTPSDYTGQEGYIVKVNATGDGLDFALPSADGVSNFTDLDDVENTYVGNSRKTLKVKEDETGIEFVDEQSVKIREIDSENYQIQPEDNGYFLYFTSVNGCVVTVPSGLPAEFNFVISQIEASGSVSWSGSGVTFKNPFGHTQTNGEGASVSFISPIPDTFVVNGVTA